MGHRLDLLLETLLLLGIACLGETLLKDGKVAGLIGKEEFAFPRFGLADHPFPALALAAIEEFATDLAAGKVRIAASARLATAVSETASVP